MNRDLPVGREAEVRPVIAPDKGRVVGVPANSGTRSWPLAQAGGGKGHGRKNELRDLHAVQSCAGASQNDD